MSKSTFGKRYTAPSSNEHQIEKVWVLVELKLDYLTFNCLMFGQRAFYKFEWKF